MNVIEKMREREDCVLDGLVLSTDRRLNSVREKKRRMGTDENVLSDMRDCQHRIQKQGKRSKIRV